MCAWVKVMLYKVKGKVPGQIRTGSRAVVARAFNTSRGRQRQADLSEFKASLLYKVSSRTVGSLTRRITVLKNQKKIKRKKGWRDGSAVKG